LSETSEQTDSVLVDVITNLLGVFILITMVSLIAATSSEVTSTPDTPHDVQPFSELPLRLFPAPASYVWVGESGVYPVPMSAIGHHLASHPDHLNGQIDGFAFDLEDELRLDRLPRFAEQADRVRRDWTVYRLTVRLDPAQADPTAVLTGSPSETATHLVTALPAGGALTLIADPGGFERFVAIHDALAEADVCFRWVVRAMSEGVVFTRKAHMFTRAIQRRC